MDAGTGRWVRFDGRIGRDPRIVPPAADPESNERTLDGKLAAEQAPHGTVFFANVAAGRRGMGVDNPLPLPVHVALIGRNRVDGRRAGPERGPFHGPRFVFVPLEIVEQDIGPLLDQLFLRSRCAATKHGQSVSPYDRVLAQRIRRPPRMEAHGIVGPAGDFGRDGLVAAVFEGVTHDRGRVRRVHQVERNERAEGFQRHLERAVGIFVADDPHGIAAVERDFRESAGVEGKCPRIVARGDPQFEALVEGMDLLEGVEIGVAAGAAPHESASVLLVEDVPHPQPPVAAQIDEACPDSADRHADVLEFFVAVGLLLAPCIERSHPVGQQLLVGGDQLSILVFVEGPSHSLHGPRA